MGIEVDSSGFEAGIDAWDLEFHVAAQAGMAAWGDGVKVAAIALSQGPLPTAMLRRFRPGLYSWAWSGQGTLDAEINRQTGDFAESWLAVANRVSPTLIVATVMNFSPHAHFMTGTIKMRPRPILELASANAVPLDVAVSGVM